MRIKMKQERYTGFTELLVSNGILLLIYARKSQEDKDKQVTSNEDQKTICKEIVLKKFNIDLPDSNIISDSKTGQIAGVRPGFNKIKQIIAWAIKQNYKIKIVCWKANRCGRNGEEGGYLADLVKFDQLEIITDTSGTFTSENFFMLYLEFGMGSQQSKDISDGVKRNNEYKLRNHIYPGKSPLGYVFNPNKLKGEKDHIPNPKNWDKCREWVEMILTSNYTVKESLEIMTARGLVGNKGEKVSLTKAYIFFRDIFYTGLFKLKGEIHQGCHKKLVTMTEYGKIQSIIDQRSHKQDWSNPLWFQGAEIRCGGCGGIVTGEKHRKKYKDGSIGEFFHARCTKKKSSCSEPFLNVKTTKVTTGLEDQIKSYISEMEIAEDYLNLIKRILKRRNEQEFRSAAKERELQTKRLEQEYQELKLLYDMKADGAFDNFPEKFEEKKAERLKNINIIKEEIIPDNTTYWRDLFENTCDFVLRMKKLFETGDNYSKQMVLKILGSNLILQDRKLKIEAKNAFIAIKRVQKEVDKKMGWLEPSNGLLQQSKDSALPSQFLLSTANGS